jgi:hypothetical protein
MLVLPTKVPRRCVDNPDAPVRLVGRLLRLHLKSQRVYLGDPLGSPTSGELAVDIAALKPQRYAPGAVYEFVGLLLGQGADASDPLVLSAYCGRPVHIAADILPCLAGCIDAIEVSLEFSG